MADKNKPWTDHGCDPSIPIADELLNDKIKQYLIDNLRIEKKTYMEYASDDSMVECTNYKLILCGEVISETY